MGNGADGQAGGILFFLLDISSGILQGCPLCGSLSVLVIEPLLWSFKAKLSCTIIRICADDIGMALGRLGELCLIYKIFHDSDLATNLHEEPRSRRKAF